MTTPMKQDPAPRSASAMPPWPEVLRSVAGSHLAELWRDAARARIAELQRELQRREGVSDRCDSFMYAEIGRLTSKIARDAARIGELEKFVNDFGALQDTWFNERAERIAALERERDEYKASDLYRARCNHCDWSGLWSKEWESVRSVQNAHDATCPKHPMRALEAENARLITERDAYWDGWYVAALDKLRESGASLEWMRIQTNTAQRDAEMVAGESEDSPTGAARQNTGSAARSTAIQEGCPVSVAVPPERAQHAQSGGTPLSQPDTSHVPVAQSEEHRSSNPVRAGSSPAGDTTRAASPPREAQTAKAETARERFAQSCVGQPDDRKTFAPQVECEHGVPKEICGTCAAQPPSDPSPPWSAEQRYATRLVLECWGLVPTEEDMCVDQRRSFSAACANVARAAPLFVSPDVALRALGIDPKHALEGEADIKAGRVVKWEDLRAELLARPAAAAVTRDALIDVIDRAESKWSAAPVRENKGRSDYIADAVLALLPPPTVSAEPEATK